MNTNTNPTPGSGSEGRPYPDQTDATHPAPGTEPQAGPVPPSPSAPTPEADQSAKRFGGSTRWVREYAKPLVAGVAIVAVAGSAGFALGRVSVDDGPGGGPPDPGFSRFSEGGPGQRGGHQPGPHHGQPGGPRDREQGGQRGGDDERQPGDRSGGQQDQEPDGQQDGQQEDQQSGQQDGGSDAAHQSPGSAPDAGAQMTTWLIA